ncbi:RNA-binding protein [Prochlorococcus sp. MIT 1307]|uniref:RNA recognition motif domain-containing protein n=1 Tax=Prochlorococcus sp. MIT 1307 TaxID=3096219 RepID=UPI002A766859|nr:RNA-binding protein [Prochlorococcus sp. MIT 1307]
MSVRLYIGNLPQTFDSKELEGLFAAIGKGIRFKPVFDRESGGCRGFGFANVEDEKLANAVIEQLNGREFNGNNLRVERSERRESNNGGGRRNSNSSNGNSHSKRKQTKKVVHSDAPNEEAPDPRWAGELAKLKELLANQKTPV